MQQLFHRTCQQYLLSTNSEKLFYLKFQSSSILFFFINSTCIAIEIPLWNSAPLAVIGFGRKDSLRDDIVNSGIPVDRDNLMKEQRDLQPMAFSHCLSHIVLLKYSKYQQVVDFADRSLPDYLVHLWTGSCVRARGIRTLVGI